MGGHQDIAEKRAKDAERQRRYRRRRRDGVQVVPVEVDAGILNTLIKDGRLSEQDLLDPKKIADALLERQVRKRSGPGSGLQHPGPRRGL